MMLRRSFFGSLLAPLVAVFYKAFAVEGVESGPVRQAIPDNQGSNPSDWWLIPPGPRRIVQVDSVFVEIENRAWVKAYVAASKHLRYITWTEIEANSLQGIKNFKIWKIHGLRSNS